MTRSDFDQFVRDQFRANQPDAPPRVGVEAEFLCIRAEGRRPAPPRAPEGSEGPGSVDIVARLARQEGWTSEEGPELPRFRRPDGTTISWEPGGQMEFATLPLASLDEVDRAVTRATSQVEAVLAEAGVELLGRGLDPWAPVAEARLWLDATRYQRMARHYDGMGEDGRRMMRQSAAIHVNLDLGPDPLERWSRANACAPAALAIFANSPIVEGRPGWRSERSRAWRGLDPTRTGAFGHEADPAAAYTAFARGARAFLVGAEDGPAEPWGARDDALGLEAWRTHLTTLFPEVRPRGYLEIRSVDALPPSQVVLAAAFLAGCIYGEAEPPDVEDPTRERLERAGRDGVGDADLRREALAWWECALAGLRGLGPGFASASLLTRLEAFRDAFTAEGLDPGVRAG